MKFADDDYTKVTDLVPNWEKNRQVVHEGLFPVGTKAQARARQHMKRGINKKQACCAG